MVAVAAASAATADQPPIDATPAELFGAANAELTDANQVLSQIDLSHVSDESYVETAIGNEIEFQNNLLKQNDSIWASQENILSHANPLGLQLDNALFTQADQGIYQGDDELLIADQHFATVTAILSPDSADLPLFVPSLELVAGYLDAYFADIIGGLLQSL